MDAFDLLVRDHHRIADLLGRLARAGDSRPDDVAELLGELRALLHAHEAGERCAPGTSAMALDHHWIALAARGEEEHHLADVLVDELTVLEPDEASWPSKLAVLDDLLTTHFLDEETRLFPGLRAGLSRDALARLSERIVARHDELLALGAGATGRLGAAH